MTLPSTRMDAARAEVKHALELLAIPPRDPTRAMLSAGVRHMGLMLKGDRARLQAIWSAMYDAAIAEKEGK